MKRLLYLLLLCLCICCRPEPSVTPGGESSDPAAVPKALVSGCLVDGRRLGASGLVVDVPI